MKKVFCFIMLLVLSVIGHAIAEETVDHYIPEGEVTFKLPIDILCISRDSDDTNSFFQIPGFDYETTHQYLIDNEYYLYGMTTDFKGEFSVRMTDYNDEDFNSMDGFSFIMTMENIKKTFISLGATDIKCEVYQGKEKKGIRMKYTSVSSGTSNKYVEFYCITNLNKLLMIRFISMGSEISDKQEKMLQKIVESAVWEKKNYTSGAKGETNLNIYTDNETGLSFLIPSGWNEVQFVAAEEGKKVKYRVGDSQVWVAYECKDLWNMFTQNYGDLIETAGMTREAIGNDFLSKEMVAKQVGCDESDISLITIDGQEYYCLNYTTTYNTELLSVDMQNIIYICVKNAYMYWFQLGGVGLSDYEDQFNRFMKTIEYPNETPEITIKQISDVIEGNWEVVDIKSTTSSEDLVSSFADIKELDGSMTLSFKDGIMTVNIEVLGQQYSDETTYVIVEDKIISEGSILEITQEDEDNIILSEGETSMALKRICE